LQILWINLVTDGVLDKTFPFAKEEGSVMAKPPKNIQKQFLDKIQIFRVVFFSLIMGIIAFEFYKYLLKTYSYDLALSISFTSIVMIQWVNGLQAQKTKEPFLKNIKKSFSTNPLIFVGLSFGIVLQILAIYGMSEIFNAVHLGLKYWRYPLFISLLAFLVVEIRKWLEILFDFFLNRYKGKKNYEKS
jgi:P-type Ca2+ transporter type 2C